ncbi:MAG: DNA-binding protein [Candidatus Bathyarchaeia archaeon]|nr:DNA-binding protein [Candidatus Bathyarchaeota archaeon]
MSDRELEELRQRKLLELQRKIAEEQQKAQIQQQIEMQKQEILRNILTPEARQRLANLKLVKPEFTAQLESYLIQLAQYGKLPIPLTDEQLKRILMQLQSHRREIKIRRI